MQGPTSFVYHTHDANDPRLTAPARRRASRVSALTTVYVGAMTLLAGSLYLQAVGAL